MVAPLFNEEVSREILGQKGRQRRKSVANFYGCSESLITRIWSGRRPVKATGKRPPPQNKTTPCARPKYPWKPAIGRRGLHPVVQELLRLMNAQRIIPKHFAKIVGLQDRTFGKWFHDGHSPKLANVSAALEALNYTLVVVPRAGARTPMGARMDPLVRSVFQHMDWLGMSTAALSDACGVPTPTIDSWKMGSPALTSDLYAAMDVLNLTVVVEFGGSE